VQTKNIAFVAILTAACIGIQLTPRPPNVEFTTFIVFMIGVWAGTAVGILSAAAVMCVNGFLSPWGYAGMNLPFQVAGAFVAALIGGFYGHHLPRGKSVQFCFETSVLGALIALAYDIATNFGFAMWQIVSGIDFGTALAVTAIGGALFSAVHVVSNAIIFGAFFVPLAKVYGNYFLKGGKKIG
jgi:hypothetical protein